MRVELQPPLAAKSIDVDYYLGQPPARGVREASIRPATTAHPVIESRCEGATRCVTPRQTCPRPNGFGRNLHSKTRWFMGFCNSHQVSHFAMFFIDARAEIYVAESHFFYRRSTGFDNDPSADSPTETLLRLLLHLNDKVQWTSRNVAGSEPPTSPRSKHLTESFNR
ncbi:putative cucumisin-like [Capsicum annuum]|nr:putative cucumisin-like [Capsicum annuum]KAF3655958.1 putative cucumisin-like [Capsicum annuum]